MKKNTILLTVLLIQIYNNSNAQITPISEIWNEIIPNFEHATILEIDTTSNSDYIILTDRFIKTNDGRTILKHDLKLLYGDITRLTYTIPRKYVNSFTKTDDLKFSKLGYKRNFGGLVIAFELYLKYSKYFNADYITSFYQTKNAKLNSYNEMHNNRTQQNFEKLKDNHFLCSYMKFNKKYDTKNFTVVYSHGIIKEGNYLFFIDIINTKKRDNTFSLEKMIVELYNNNRININNILFETGKAAITDESKEIIKVIADYLTIYSDVKLQINGHTDNVGPNANNLELSKQRALAIVNSLADDYNIEKTRLTANGFGKEKPIASNDTEEGRKQNRRVELVIKD